MRGLENLNTDESKKKVCCGCEDGKEIIFCGCDCHDVKEYKGNDGTEKTYLG